MRLFSRAIVTSVAACALAVGWMGVSDAAAVPASEPPAARHIVVFHDDADSDAVARDHGRRYGAQVEHVYHNALKGYVATFKGTGAADVARDPESTSSNSTARSSHHQATQPVCHGALTGSTRRNASAQRHFHLQRRRDRRHRLHHRHRHPVQPHRLRRPGRAGLRRLAAATARTATATAPTWPAPSAARPTVSPRTSALVSVRVLDCNGSGSWSGVIAGIDWVTADHDAGEPAVANMSLGGGARSAVDAAVSKSISDGVTYAVAAGNGNKPESPRTPAGFRPPGSRRPSRSAPPTRPTGRPVVLELRQVRRLVRPRRQHPLRRIRTAQRRPGRAPRWRRRTPPGSSPCTSRTPRPRRGPRPAEVRTALAGASPPACVSAGKGAQPPLCRRSTDRPGRTTAGPSSRAGRPWPFVVPCEGMSGVVDGKPKGRLTTGGCLGPSTTPDAQSASTGPGAGSTWSASAP